MSKTPFLLEDKGSEIQHCVENAVTGEQQCSMGQFASLMLAPPITVLPWDLGKGLLYGRTISKNAPPLALFEKNRPLCCLLAWK